jgi:hypothetical protein
MENGINLFERSGTRARGAIPLSDNAFSSCSRVTREQNTLGKELSEGRGELACSLFGSVYEGSPRVRPKDVIGGGNAVSHPRT